MTAIEIILIIIGFICLCVSCFVAKKNSSYAEGEKESLSSELWTEREDCLLYTSPSPRDCS